MYSLDWFEDVLCCAGSLQPGSVLNLMAYLSAPRESFYFPPALLANGDVIGFFLVNP